MRKLQIILSLILGLTAMDTMAQNGSISIKANLKSTDTAAVQGDTTKFKWGNKIVVIYDDTAFHSVIKDTTPPNKYRWAGVDFGVNGLLNSSGSMNLKDAPGTAPIDQTEFMDIDLRHSWMLRINPIEFNLRTKNQRLGILTGLGFEWNSYELSNNVRLIHNGASFVDTSSAGISEAYTWGILDNTTDYSKNRLKVFTLNVPLLVDVNLGKNKDFYIAAGGIIGFNLNSKMKYKSSDGKEKSKVDYNINPLSMSLYGKVGYRGVGFFGSYGLTGLFEDGKGPQVSPFTLGISFNTN